MINRYFDVLVTGMSSFVTPLQEAVWKFRGIILARPFGREAPHTYTELFPGSEDVGFLDKVQAIGNRFVFAQAYDVLAEVEDRRLARNARTISLPVPLPVWERAGDWRGGYCRVLLLCPDIRDGAYHEALFGWIKTIFRDLPHLVFGRQSAPVNDPVVGLADGRRIVRALCAGRCFRLSVARATPPALLAH